MNTVKRLIKNTSVLFLSQMISYILAFFYTLYSARYLGTSNFGIISFATATSGLFAILTDLGISTLTIREVARDKSRTYKYLGNTGTIKFLLSILTMVLLILYVNIFSFDEITRVVVYIIGSSVIINSFSGIFTAIFRAYEDMEYQSVSEIISAVLIFTGILYCVFTNKGVIGVAYVYLISNTIVLIYNFVICSKRYGLIHFQIDFEFWKKVIYHAFPLAITSIFALISFKMNTILLTMMTTQAITGEYTAAFNLMQALIFIPTVYSSAVMPLFSRLYVDKKDLLNYSYNKSLKYLTVLSIPISMGTMVLSNKIIMFIYGATYVNTIPILELIIWALPAIFLSYILGISIAAINKQHETVKATFICMLFSIFGNYILIHFFGGLGAAMITVINEVSMVLFYLHIMSKYNYHTPLKSIIPKPLIASIVMGIIIYYLNLNLLFSIILGIIVYVVMVLLLRTFDKDDLNILQKLLPEKLNDKINKFIN